MPKDGYGGNVTMTLRFLDARILGVEVDVHSSLAEMYEHITQKINGFASTKIDSSQLKLIQGKAIVPYNSVDKVYDRGFELENIINVTIGCRSKNFIEGFYKEAIEEINRNKFENIDIKKILMDRLNESDSKEVSLRDIDLLCVLRYLLQELNIPFDLEASKGELRDLLLIYLNYDWKEDYGQIVSMIKFIKHHQLLKRHKIDNENNNSIIKSLIAKLKEKNPQLDNKKGIDSPYILKYLLTEFGLDFAPGASKEELRESLLNYLSGLLAFGRPSEDFMKYLSMTVGGDLFLAPAVIEEEVVHGGAGGGT